MADLKISELTAVDQATLDPANTYIPLYSVGGTPLNPRMNLSTIRVGTLTAGNGTAGAPALAFASDPNTGIYNAAANQIGFSTDGVVRATLSTSALTMTVPVAIADGTVGAPSLAFASSPTTGLYRSAADVLAFACNGVLQGRFTSGALLLSSSAYMSAAYYVTGSGGAAGFYSKSETGALYLGASDDCVLTRDAPGTFAIRSTTNPQTLRLYNTYTDASNYERGVFKWSSNVLQIGTEAAGTGTARSLELLTGGTARLTIGATGTSTFAGSVLVPDGTLSAPGIAFSSETGLGFYRTISGAINFCAGNARLGFLFSGGLAISNNQGIQWYSAGFAANDISLIRDGSPGVLSQRSATTPQTYLLYNTYTDASNYERGVFKWATNVLQIGTEAAGTGTARDLVLGTGTTFTERLRVNSSGVTIADAHNVVLDTTTGTKIGTATGQKLAFWNSTPVVQQVLATGGGATVDNVITLLQTLGLCKQA